MTKVGFSARVNADDFGRFARATKSADKDIQKAVRKALRDVAKPLGADVSRKGSEPMPHRGGLRARLARNKVGISTTLGGTSPKVTLRLGAKPGIGLATLNRGQLRHPVYGNRKRWVSQRVPAGTYDRAFQEGAPEVQRAAFEAATDVFTEIARRV